jgi:hypothetical protein
MLRKLLLGLLVQMVLKDLLHLMDLMGQMVLKDLLHLMDLMGQEL